MHKEYSVNVLQAAEKRIVAEFNKNNIVVLAFSGGKDSIVLADVVVKTMQKYNISFSRLRVQFFDEEAIYPDIEKITLQWRSKFLSLGAKFYWWCLPIKHFNCCNKLASDESFICWEDGKQDVWVRQPPKFSIRSHTKFKAGMTYQRFASSLWEGIQGVGQMAGVRMAESIQRRQAISKRKHDKFSYPLYDWKDSDIWLYCKMFDIEIPEAYIYMYKTGVPLNRLRISQFFSIDTIKVLPKVLEFYPSLYQAIVKREPNADLVILYHETAMFRSSKEETAHDIKVNYKERFESEMKIASTRPTEYAGYKLCARLLADKLKDMPEKWYKNMYEMLIGGDPKMRTYRKLKADLRRID